MTEWNWVSKLEELRALGAPIAVVTVGRVSGSTPRGTGAKMLVLGDGTFFGTIGGGHLEQLVLEDARKFLAEATGRGADAGASGGRVVQYPLGAKAGQCCGGVVEILFESVNAGPLLYVFGAGHVGQAVSRVFLGTPFSTHLVDERPEWIRSQEIPSSVFRHECRWDDFVDEAEWDAKRTYAVIMTHRHDTDQEIVEGLLKRPARYVGLIGSQAKWGRFRQRLTARGVEESVLARVKCPIGLPIGGKAPQEVAVSLAAELIGMHYAG